MARRWKGQTQEQRRAERRRLLIGSAVRLYGAHGFRNVGVRAVCRDAGLTERYFYESFANGEELLLATFGEVVAFVRGQMIAADDLASSPEMRARAMLRAYFATLAADATATRVFLVEVVGVHPLIDAAFEESLGALSQPLLDALDPQGQGPLSADPLLRRAVVGGLLHLALGWRGEDYARPVDAVVDTAIALCRLATPPSAPAGRTGAATAGYLHGSCT
jgi:AcrR family transcriptional regulator